MLANLSTAYRITAAATSSSVAPVDEAVASVRAAVAALPADDVARVLTNLAAALRKRHDLTNGISSLRSAVDSLESYVALGFTSGTSATVSENG